MKTKEEKQQLFERLYAENADVVLKAAMKYTREEELAQDVMQDTFMKLYIHLDEIEETYVRGWLLTIARNQAINCVKKRRREIVEEDIVLVSDLRAHVRDLEEEILEKEREESMQELKEQIFDAMYRENPRWYKAAMLGYCTGKPQKQVAEEMNISLEGLHSMLYRARSWVRKKYGEQFRSVDA